MRSRSNLHIFVLALCVLAMFAAQTFGVQSGYVCVCSGNAVVTNTTHCHGPHGSQCHAPGAESSGSHNEGEQGSREDHPALKEGLPMRCAEAGVIAPIVLLATLPLLEILLAPPVAIAPASTVAITDNLLPFGATVARTVVLLI